MRDFLGVSLADEPSKYYFIIRSKRIVVEADSSIQLIMEKLQSYKSKVALYYEGFQYQLGDFRLRVVPTHSENVRGIVMEVEYLPISSMEKARKVMEEFLEIWHEALSKRSFPGKFVNIEHNFGEFGLADNYTPQHTAVRYALVLGDLSMFPLSVLKTLILSTPFPILSLSWCEGGFWFVAWCRGFGNLSILPEICCIVVWILTKTSSRPSDGTLSWTMAGLRVVLDDAISLSISSDEGKGPYLIPSNYGCECSYH